MFKPEPEKETDHKEEQGTYTLLFGPEHLLQQQVALRTVQEGRHLLVIHPKGSQTI